MVESYPSYNLLAESLQWLALAGQLMLFDRRGEPNFLDTGFWRGEAYTADVDYLEYQRILLRGVKNFALQLRCIYD